MKDVNPGKTKIDRLLEMEPITVGERRIQPVARMTGWQFTGDQESGAFAIAVGRLAPVEVRVRTDDEETVIPVADPDKEPLRNIAVTGVVLSIVCTLIMLAVRIAARRQSRRD
jgi:hypothetical protein